ncbi:MAG: L-2-hydroxyglutarate oxidase [Candidatus Hydrogenedentota bacterium]
MIQDKSQFLIVGAGITGLAIARELLKKEVDDIVILEKEATTGIHASGRNSGVLHAGIYYSPDTLKAKYCVSGNQLMKEFCKDKGLTLKENGKVIVTKSYEELEVLYNLKQRADSARAKAYIIDEKELGKIEPYAKTCEKALYSPDTAVFKPLEVLKAMEQDLVASKKVKILYNTKFLTIEESNTALVSDLGSNTRAKIRFSKFINAAGCFADKIAQSFGLSKEYKILPFKGTYKKLIKEKSHLVRGNIYPVPDLKNPFLGVHFTNDADNEVEIGPTVFPALGRENYGLFDGIDKEIFDIIYNSVILLSLNNFFREYAFKEIKKYRKKFVYETARKLVPQLLYNDIVDSDKIGIRAQLLNWQRKELVMDFVVEKTSDSVHILNAVSPAFTSSMAFAKHIVSLL